MLKSAFQEWIGKDLELMDNGLGEWSRVQMDIRDGEVSNENKLFRKGDFTESVINEYIDAMENARMLSRW